MAEIAGRDTIATTSCPDLGETVEVPKEIIKLGQKVLTKWWAMGMSFIPYCTQCKEPLVWHSPPDGDVLFHCPICSRYWIKDNEWIITDNLRADMRG